MGAGGATACWASHSGLDVAVSKEMLGPGKELLNRLKAGIG